MRAKKHYMWGLFAVVLLLATPAFPFRAEPEAQNPDPMRELLVEVRGLRAAMEQLASAGPQLRKHLARLTAETQPLQAEDSTLTSLISVEQNRRTDISRMLDELDRTLSRR